MDLFGSHWFDEQKTTIRVCSRRKFVRTEKTNDFSRFRWWRNSRHQIRHVFRWKMLKMQILALWSFIIMKTTSSKWPQTIKVKRRKRNIPSKSLIFALFDLMTRRRRNSIDHGLAEQRNFTFKKFQLQRSSFDEQNDVRKVEFKMTSKFDFSLQPILCENQ